MNELQIFNSPEFGDIRTVTIDNETYFVGKDVATALGYANPKNAVPTHVSEEDKLSTQIEYAGQRREVTVINESGLYALIFGSKLESAKRFKHWVTSEVLPAIHHNGGYIMGQENLSDSELMAKAILVAQKTIEHKNQIIEQQKAKIEADRPKTIFADAVSTSHTSILIGDLAKLICQNGVQTGQKRLFQWMRENGYLMKTGASYNMPMQRYIEQGLFEVKESSVQNPDGSVRVTRTTKVTGKGQLYFINKFLGNEIAS
ncbi:MAG: antirepressor protein KilAC domain [Bacteriophage sp.]|jgi:anti-repressor protein|nr:MAG: antirepressor protein KilAC domain [Bacteriophage sp.]DAH09243.1 MAG TPA: KilAC domain protein [Caudoviricetes sp.]